jgi:hypothetical protein
MYSKIIKTVELENEYILICYNYTVYTYKKDMCVDFSDWYVYNGRLVYFKDSLKDFVYVPLKRTAVKKVKDKDIKNYYKYML